jgi:hypothetical protein
VAAALVPSTWVAGDEEPLLDVASGRAWSLASSVRAGAELVAAWAAASARGWSGCSPCHTASAVISEVTAATARAEGTSAPTSERWVR